MQIHWHRRDLRVADNRGLAAATGALDADDAGEPGPVVPLFVFDRDVLAHAGPPRVAFMLDALASLRAAYRERGSDLLVRRGDPRGVVPEVAASFDADRVTWASEVSGLGRERDAAVRRALDDDGVARESVEDHLLHEPGSIRTNQGEVYSVFTYFWKKWRDRAKLDPVDPPADADLLDTAEIAADYSLPTLADLGFDEPEADVPPASTDAARELLAGFCESDIYDYDERRDYPADGCTSRLSAHLKFGTIGLREVYAATESAMARAKDRDDGDDDSGPEAEADELGPAQESVRTFQSQLAWREFYAQVLYFNPEIVSQNYKAYEEPIEWRNDADELAAWKRGETGYPIVDAGMRQLDREGYVHNRPRQVVASFLTKHLLVDWRKGARHFEHQLVDHDPAVNYGNWQWVASTGTDTVDVRIFDPVAQMDKYDPDADYVREYVPELQDVPPEKAVEWPTLDAAERARFAPDYPDPIVDRDGAYERARRVFETALGQR